jgi:hypothetical protein
LGDVVWQCTQGFDNLTVGKVFGQIKSPAVSAGIYNETRSLDESQAFILGKRARRRRGLGVIDRKADDDPQMIEIFDKIQTVIGRSDLSMKQRLIQLGRLLAQARDGGRTGATRPELGDCIDARCPKTKPAGYRRRVFAGQN